MPVGDGGGVANIAPFPLGALEAGLWGGLSVGGVNMGSSQEAAVQGCGGAGACSLADNLSLLLTAERRARSPSKHVKPAESCESWLTSVEYKAPLMEPSALVKTLGLDFSSSAVECAACSWRDGSAATSHCRVPGMVPALVSEPPLGQLGRGRCKWVPQMGTPTLRGTELGPRVYLWSR